MNISMDLNVRLSNAENLLIEILFNENKIENEKFINVNYDLFVKIASSHLMIPAVYSNLRRKNYLEKIPRELAEYLKKIYTLNRERNKNLIVEALDLSKALKLKKIEFKFLKGTFFLINNLYFDLGERMIGDIDFLVKKNDLDCVTEILHNSGYFNKGEYFLWKTKHLPRFFHKKKVFAIEPHSEVVIYRKRKHINPKKIIESSKDKEIENQIKICILNYQINDYGNLNANFSYRTLYDFVQLVGKTDTDIKKFKGKYFKRFFLITNYLGVTDYNINLNFLDRIFLKRFKLKRKYKFYYTIDKLLCDLIRLIPKKVMQILEFITNKNYRKNAIKKLRYGI